MNVNFCRDTSQRRQRYKLDLNWTRAGEELKRDKGGTN